MSQKSIEEATAIVKKHQLFTEAPDPIRDSWAHDNTDQPAPLRCHAASTRQTIAELIEAKADASAIAHNNQPLWLNTEAVLF